MEERTEVTITSNTELPAIDVDAEMSLSHQVVSLFINKNVSLFVDELTEKLHEMGFEAKIKLDVFFQRKDS
jgi:hypothetical protein